MPKSVQPIDFYFPWYEQWQLLFTTRLSATKVFQIYSLQGNYLQLDIVD